MPYIGQSRSVRSQEAIEKGLVVKSQLKAWQKRAVDQGAVFPCEWHHTGKFYNRTNYYNLDDFEALDPKDFPPVKNKPASTNWYVLVSARWGGTKRYPRIVGTDIKITNKLTSRQENAKKYSDYGGYIKTFDTEDQAKTFAKTAELKND